MSDSQPPTGSLVLNWLPILHRVKRLCRRFVAGQKLPYAESVRPAMDTVTVVSIATPVPVDDGCRTNWGRGEVRGPVLPTQRVETAVSGQRACRFSWRDTAAESDRFACRTTSMDGLNSLTDDQVALLGCAVALVLCGGAMVISHTLRRWTTGESVQSADRSRRTKEDVTAASTNADRDRRKAA